MRQYEITFIIDPVLPGDEMKAAAKAYEKLIGDEGCTIVNIDDVGLQQLAYPINKKNSGIYKCIEFQTDAGDVIPKIELAMRRDERIMRFLTVKLDKYAIKYNEDSRNGLIGTNKKASTKKEPEDVKTFVRKDDLTLIEGVGPKASKLMRVSGITSYSALSAKTPNELKDILTKGGPAFAGIEPSSWPDQAQLAADGKWTELNKLKASLVNGIVVVDAEEE